MPTRPELHTQRKEIARYLLSRGTAEFGGQVAADAAVKAPVADAAMPVYPDGLAPTPAPLATAPSPTAKLPKADVVVITWTVDEVAALAQILTPGVSAAGWYPYSRNFASFRPNIRPHAPGREHQAPRQLPAAHHRRPRRWWR